MSPERLPRQLLGITVRADEVELVSDLLWSVGVEGIEERDCPEGALLVTEATDALVSAVSGRWPYELVDVDLGESLDAWREWATATVLDATSASGAVVVLRAPWVPGPVRGALEVVIDPGRSWGHGGHPTTRGAAELLVGAADRSGVTGFASVTVLDVGSGSGVLSILAARLGAGRVVATDIDPLALEATASNASRNAAVIDVVATLPDGPFDVVVANIDASVLVDLAGTLVVRLAPKGRLILSGMLGDAVGRVRDRCPQLTEVGRWTDGSWVAIALQ